MVVDQRQDVLRSLHAYNEAFRTEMADTRWVRPSTADSLRYVCQEAAEVLSDWMKLHRAHARNHVGDLHGELADLVMMALTALPAGWDGPGVLALCVNDFNVDDLVFWASDALRDYLAGNRCGSLWALERILVSCVFYAPGFDARRALERKFDYYRTKYRGNGRCETVGCTRAAVIEYNGAHVCQDCHDDMARGYVKVRPQVTGHSSHPDIDKRP